jgi:probable phosphoglycerate mutase
MARTMETAAAIARPHALGVRPAPGLVELDYGAWTGRAFDALAGDAAWTRWNTQRALAAPPGGEPAVAAQARAVAAMLALADAHPGGRVVAVTHADVLRMLLGHLLGVPLDHLLRLDVDPASVSEVELAPWGARVLRVNDTAGLPPDLPPAAGRAAA